MVIAVHTSHGLKEYHSIILEAFRFGGLGVQLFFVASAITLCISLKKTIYTSGWIANYASRRYFRIAPMYYCGIFFYFIWSFGKNYIHNGTFTPLEVYSDFNILANVLFIHGFIPSAYNSIVPGGWSIAVEMGFYLIFPFILGLYERYSRHRLLLTAILLMTCWCTIGLAQIITEQSTIDNDFWYFNITNQLHVFIIGIYGYFSLESLRKLNPLILTASIALTFWLGAFFFTQEFFNARFFSLALYALSFVLLIVWLEKSQIRLILLETIGQRSFSMYIIHFFVLNMVEYLLNIRFEFLPENLIAKAIAHLSIAVAFTYIISGFTKKHIEDQFIKLGATWTKKYV